jgi:hypothetical protein
MKRETVAGVATVRLLCKTFAVSRQAYYASQKAPEPSAKVLRLPVRPDVAPAAKVLAHIKVIIGENPAWGVRKVWAALRREHELKVSKKRVWAIMKANGLVLARDSEPGEPTRGHVAVPEPNRRLAADFTTVWTKLDGVVAVVPTIDCGCRSVLGMEVTKDQQAPAVLASVEQALREAFENPSAVPLDLELRTDHGPQYTGADCAGLVSRWGSGSVADQEASLTGTRRDLRVSAMPASQRSLRASARSWTMWVPVASCQREPQRRKRTSKRFLQVASVRPLPMGRPC